MKNAKIRIFSFLFWSAPKFNRLYLFSICLEQNRSLFCFSRCFDPFLFYGMGGKIKTLVNKVKKQDKNPLIFQDTIVFFSNFFEFKMGNSDRFQYLRKKKQTVQNQPRKIRNNKTNQNKINKNKIETHKNQICLYKINKKQIKNESKISNKRTNHTRLFIN